MVIHNCPCNECGAAEIIGIRYKCTQRQDFSICQACEEKEGVNSVFSYIKIRKPEMAPVHLVCQYDNQVQENKVVELRHAPVAEDLKKPNPLLSKFEDEDIDKSFVVDNMPPVHPPAPVTHPAIAISELNQSTLEKVKFVDQVDQLPQDKKKFAPNLLHMLSMGFTEFDACMAALEVHNNDFEMACNSFLY